MKYIRLYSKSPYVNLAVEEFLFTHTEDDVFMLWQNAPTVVIGKNQNAYAEVDLSYIRENGILLARRITGGGAVYHDDGNINFTFISGSERARPLDYAYFTRPIVEALSALGLACEPSGRNDLLADGKKISGNAQCTKNGRTLHHGTLLFDSDTDRMSAALRIDREKLEYHAVRSHKSRVANIRALLDMPITAEEFIDLLEGHILRITGAVRVPAPTDPRIDELTARNASEEWLLSDRRYLTAYTETHRKRFPFGSVEIRLSLLRDAVTEVLITGDFFELSEVSRLEAVLCGLSANAVAAFDPSPYIGGMTQKHWQELLEA